MKTKQSLCIVELNIHILIFLNFFLISPVYFFLCRLRLACWQYVRTGISSWPKTSKKLTRLSSKRMSRSTSSTSREKKWHPEKKKVSRHTSLLLIYICVSVSTLCLVDLQSPTCIDFWTKFTHCSTRPTVRLALCPALKKTHYHVTRCFFCTGTLLVSKNIRPRL